MLPFSRLSRASNVLLARNMRQASSLTNMGYRVEENGVAVITLDIPDEKMNTLSAALTQDFENVLKSIETDSAVKSAVLISGKPDNFIAGADIKQLKACSTAAELEALSTHGQGIMDRISDSKKPIVAAINGACLGGGLEVALACHYRIATENKKTVMALPEVMLGLLPGAGGTQRLPKLVGLQKALPMLLTGKNIRPKQAKRMGLVDQLADPFALEGAAIQAASQLASGDLKIKKKKKGTVNKILENTGPGQNLVFSMAKKQVDKASGGNYPAPYKILESVKAGLQQGHKGGSKVEAHEFGKLGMTPESKSLISIFFGQTAAKKNRFGTPEKPVETIGVVGAGLMGAGIAQVSAMKGYRVLLKDRDHTATSSGLSYATDNLNKRVKKRAMTAYERDTILANIVPLADTDTKWGEHMAKADMVIEAVFEDMQLKHKIIQSMEEHIPEHCVFATNTSALPITEIATASKRPEKVIGMHYFSPVPQMPLLEIITHEGTSNETAAQAVGVGIKQGKTCVVVKDVPGFYVNRCLGPYLAESMSLVQSGVELLVLDKAMKRFGLPVGPITLADEVGVDVANHVATFLGDHLGTRMQGADPACMQQMVDKGFLGKKTGQGFFTHKDEFEWSWSAMRKVRKPKQLNPDAVALVKSFQKESLTLSEEEIQHRMIGRFINEAVLCLQDDIIESPTDGDIGAIFGMGFPPFHGGPFRYVDAVGADTFVDEMKGFADKYGEQFEPCQMLQDYAKSGTKFHND